MDAPGALVSHYQQLPYKKAKIDKYPWLDNPFEGK